MNAKSFSISVQGASHIKRDKECQDASKHYQDDKMFIAIVCDGHGGDDYMRSAKGSEYACNIAERNIKQFISSVDAKEFLENSDKRLRDLEASIISGWNQLIRAHFEQNPFTEYELCGISERARKKYTEDNRIESAYGTTLIAVAVTPRYWFGIHIGDGKCVAVNPEGRFLQPIPWDDKCFLNATTSICDSDAINNFRHFYSTKLPVAVFIGSDGIDDCFGNKEQLNNLYKTILYSFGTTVFDQAVKDLEEYLPQLSAKGSGDDVSIAAVLDMDLVPGLDVVKNFDREKEKARIEENARKEAEHNEAERKRVEEEHARFVREHRSMIQEAPPVINSNTSGEESADSADGVDGNDGSFVGGEKPKYCRNCGAKLLEDAKFCTDCGAEVFQVSMPVTENDNALETILQQEDTPVNEAEEKLLELTSGGLSEGIEFINIDDDEIQEEESDEADSNQDILKTE